MLDPAPNQPAIQTQPVYSRPAQFVKHYTPHTSTPHTSSTSQPTTRTKKTKRPLTYRHSLRRWWEFQTLYALLSAASPQAWFQYNHNQNRTTNPASKSTAKSTNPLNHTHYAHPKSRQSQIKRQREWIYLAHYLAIQGLSPIHIISGEDDGREPDFTLIFYDGGLYYVGVELTTLPRLRDQMGETGLIGKRWYWQALKLMTGRPQAASKQMSYSRYQTPTKTLYVPKDNAPSSHSADASFKPDRSKPRLPITQADVDAVMAKKAHKASAYHTRRPLDELWLLVHTDKHQPGGLLSAGHQPLTHRSDFDQVHITRYPSHKVLVVKSTNQAHS